MNEQVQCHMVLGADGPNTLSPSPPKATTFAALPETSAAPELFYHLPGRCLHKQGVASQRGR